MKRLKNHALFLPAIALIIGLLITGLVRHSIQSHSKMIWEGDLLKKTEHIQHKIETRLHHSERILLALIGAFNATKFFDEQEFADYIRTLRIKKSYPGIRSVGFTRFKKKNTHNEADQAYITYLEPSYHKLNQNKNFNMYKDETRRAAMDLARDHNRISMTNKLHLRFDKKPKSSLMIFAPVYDKGAQLDTIAQRRASLAGWVYITFRSKEMMNWILRDELKSLSHTLGIHIFDGSPRSKNTLLYQSYHHDISNKFETSRFYAIKNIHFADQTWVLETHSVDEFEAFSYSQRAFEAMLAGIIISLLLATLIWQLSNARSRAIALAKKINLDLVEREQRFAQMFEKHSSIAYVLNPETGDIVDVNEAGSRYWGYSIDELRQMNISQINTATYEQILIWTREAKASTVPHQSFVCQHKLKSGEIRNVEIYSDRLTFKKQRFVYSILHDITDRKKAENKLIINESKLQTIIDTATDAYVELNHLGEILDWNYQAELLFGHTKNEMLGKNCIDINIDKAARDQCRDNVNACACMVGSEQMRARFVSTGRHASGNVFPIEISATYLPQSDGLFHIYIFVHDITNREKTRIALSNAHNELEQKVRARTNELVDTNNRLNVKITEHKQAQKLLQTHQEKLRELVAHQDQIRENERKRIAREIHDDLGQNLLALRIEISMLWNSTESDSDKEQLGHIIKHIDGTISSVRLIINNLRPAVLDLGITAALEWQLQDFSRRTGITFDFIFNEEDAFFIEDEFSIVLFRILQEALSNIIRHAEAQHVIVDLVQETESLLLRISDDGIGITQSALYKTESFGLAGIRERLNALGGHLEIESSEEGTTLIITLPLSKSHK